MVRPPNEPITPPTIVPVGFLFDSVSDDGSPEVELEPAVALG